MKKLNGHLVEIVDELARSGVTLAQARRAFEKQYIVSSLRLHEGNLGRCAEAIGVHRNTLRNKVRDLKIKVRKGAPQARS